MMLLQIRNILVWSCNLIPTYKNEETPKLYDCFPFPDLFLLYFLNPTMIARRKQAGNLKCKKVPPPPFPWRSRKAKRERRNRNSPSTQHSVSVDARRACQNAHSSWRCWILSSCRADFQSSKHYSNHSIIPTSTTGIHIYTYRHILRKTMWTHNERMRSNQRSKQQDVVFGSIHWVIVILIPRRCRRFDSIESKCSCSIRSSWSSNRR